MNGQKLAVALISEVAISSFKAKKLQIDQGKLIEIGFVNGIFIWFVDGAATAMFNPSDTAQMDFAIKVLSKGALTILYRMLMNRGYEIQQILIDQVVSYAVGMATYAVFGRFWANTSQPSLDQGQAPVISQNRARPPPVDRRFPGGLPGGVFF